MCTSIVSNRNKTIIWWNLDLLQMEYRINSNSHGVYIEVYDEAVLVHHFVIIQLHFTWSVQKLWSQDSQTSE